MTPYRLELAGSLDGPWSPETAIDRWADSIADSEEMFWSFYRANFMTELAGIQFITDIEAAPLFGTKPLELARVKLATPGEVEAAKETSFLAMAFDDAIDHFAARALVSAETFDAMTEAQRFNALAMRRIASETIRENAQRLLADAMQPGGTGLRGFITAIQADEAELGFTPNSPGYLENVYRTTTSTSYNAGRLRGQMSPNVIAAGGIWTYLTVLDNRVRPAHAELHGLQWEIGDPEAQAVYPPNGYQCRCSMLVSDREDMDPARFEQSLDDLEGDPITEGFRGPPTEAIAQAADGV